MCTSFFLFLLQPRLKLLATAFCVRKYHYAGQSMDDARDNGIYMECLNPSAGIQRAQQQQSNPDSFSEQSPLKQPDEYHRAERPDPNWTLIASILDRLFFFVYLFIIILSIAFIFPR